MNARTSAASRGMIASFAVFGTACAADHQPISIRTETYPRSPDSEATYYIYERGGNVICTKLAVCDKYEQCDTGYHAGVFKDLQDLKTGKPYDVTPAVTIARAKLRKHQRLVKFVPGPL
ncbi:hypothetical protein [Pseudomonas poae]|uniref:hypothetical protein n=1 Tax=Pseudomonas poae TaxID=200451 RepID=UPI001CA3F354|nr:hypothetical protein [Pseudomonas poae]